MLQLGHVSLLKPDAVIAVQPDGRGALIYTDGGAIRVGLPHEEVLQVLGAVPAPAPAAPAETAQAPATPGTETVAQPAGSES